MKEISSTVVLYLFNLVSTYFMFLGYSFISKEKFKYNFKNIVCVIITSTLFLINNSHNSTIIKVPIIILNLLIFFKIVFNGRLRNIVIYTFTLYLALVFFDFMFSFSSENPNSKEWNLFVEIIKKNLKIAKIYDEVMNERRKKNNTNFNCIERDCIFHLKDN